MSAIRRPAENEGSGRLVIEMAGLLTLSGHKKAAYRRHPERSMVAYHPAATKDTGIAGEVGVETCEDFRP
jgi:hypothetical protein